MLWTAPSFVCNTTMAYNNKRASERVPRVTDGWPNYQAQLSKCFCCSTALPIPKRMASAMEVASQHSSDFFPQPAFSNESQASSMDLLALSCFHNALTESSLPKTASHRDFHPAVPYVIPHSFGRASNGFTPSQLYSTSPPVMNSQTVDDPKPNFSYIGLIAKAILSTEARRMILSEIYQWIQNSYPYFRTRGPGWRNSIRHNLSLNDCFIKVGRAANGKGHYWGIHPANMSDFLAGDFRRRRAQRKVRQALGLACPADDRDTPSPNPQPLTTSSAVLKQTNLIFHQYAHPSYVHQSVARLPTPFLPLSDFPWPSEPLVEVVHSLSEWNSPKAHKATSLDSPETSWKPIPSGVKRSFSEVKSVPESFLSPVQQNNGQTKKKTQKCGFAIACLLDQSMDATEPQDYSTPRGTILFDYTCSQKTITNSSPCSTDQNSNEALTVKHTLDMPKLHTFDSNHISKSDGASSGSEALDFTMTRFRHSPQSTEAL